MEAHFDVIAIFILERSDFTTNPGTGFVDFDFITLIQEFYSGGKTGKTGSDNGDFELFAGFGGGSLREKRAKRDILESYIVDITDIRGGRSLDSLRTDETTCKEQKITVGKWVSDMATGMWQRSIELAILGNFVAHCSYNTRQ